MWFGFAILFLGGLVLTSVKLSLMSGTRAALIALATALFPLLFFSQAVRLNMRHVAELLRDYGVVTTVCMVIIAESLMVMILSIRLMGEQYGEYRPRLRSKLAYVPSVIAPAGLVLSQTAMFNLVSGRPFMQSAMLNAGAAFLMLIAGYVVARILMRDWLQRLELMVVLAFFQLIIAMFIPVISLGLELPETHFALDMHSTLCTIIIMLIPAAAGYALRTSNILLRKGIIR